MIGNLDLLVGPREPGQGSRDCGGEMGSVRLWMEGAQVQGRAGGRHGQVQGPGLSDREDLGITADRAYWGKNTFI